MPRSSQPKAILEAHSARQFPCEDEVFVSLGSLEGLELDVDIPRDMP